MRRKTRASREALRRRLSLLEEAEQQADREVRIERCPSGKRVFKKKSKADAHAKRQTERNRIQHRRYHCKRCGHHHTTTKGPGLNPDTGVYENPRRLPTLSSLAGCKIVRMVRL